MNKTDFLLHMESWFAENAPFWSQGTVDKRRQHLTSLADWLDDRPVNRVTVIQWSAHLVEQGLSPNTIIDRRGVLKYFFKWLIAAKLWYDDNPVTPIRTIVRQPERRDAITWDSVQSLIRHRWPASQSYWPLAIELGWETGLRLGDVALLRWEQVGEDGVLSILPQKTERFGEPLEIPLSKEMHRRLLLYRRAGQPFVFARMAESYQRYQHRKLSEQFTNAATACGVHGSFHGLRHAFVTRLLESGVPMAVISSLTGQSFKTIGRYSHPSIDAKRTALEQAARPSAQHELSLLTARRTTGTRAPAMEPRPDSTTPME